MTDAEDLYALEPTEFTAARNALVKGLKAEGRADEAAAVAKLRRPTATAWALDQVARDNPDLVERALAAGARLRDATAKATTTGDAGALRKASAEDRDASDAVVEAAATRLGDRGPSSRRQVADTLRAAVLDAVIAAELRRGVLATDHEASAFGFGFDLGSGEAEATASPRRSATTRPRSKRATSPERVDTGGEAGERRAADRRARQEAEEKARGQRRRRAELEAAAKRLNHKYERLARMADKAEQEARRARAEADAVGLEAEAAHRQLDALS